MKILKPESGRDDLKGQEVNLVRFATDPEEGFDRTSDECPSAIVKVKSTGEELFVWMDEISVLASLPRTPMVALAGQMAIDWIDRQGGASENAIQWLGNADRDEMVTRMMNKVIAAADQDEQKAVTCLLAPCVAWGGATLWEAVGLGVSKGQLELLEAVRDGTLGVEELLGRLVGGESEGLAGGRPKH